MSERAERRVLVIDDDDLSREVLGVLLAQDGFEVEAASSGEEALLALSEAVWRPDVVLMDMQMPGISGEDLARRLRDACGGAMRLLAMSGSRTIAAESEVFDGFLLKPFSMEEFASKLLELRQSPSQNPTEIESATGQDEVLDPTIFGGLKGMVSEEQLRALYQHCLADAAKQVDLMRAAALAKNDVELRKCAHAIKGSLGMVGARELQAMCGHLEEVGLSGDSLATLGGFAAALQRLWDKLTALGVHLRG